MRNVVIALSGRIGSGKADLGERLASAIGGESVSFGEEVRAYAREMGKDPDDVGILQMVGQTLVLTQLGGFVGRVLAQRTRTDVPLVLVGLRHVEVMLELRERLGGVPFRLCHVETPSDVRAARVMARAGVERRLVARYEADIVEEQSSRVMPQYADVVVDGRLPLALQVSRIVTSLDLVHATRTHAGASDRPVA